MESMQLHRHYSLEQSPEETLEIRERVKKANAQGECFDSMFKVVLIGGSSTGKTSMLLRFSENTFIDQYLCTIGVDFKIKTLTVDGFRTIKLQVWDTAGQERFQSISQAYYRNSHGCIAVYDISNR